MAGREITAARSQRAAVPPERLVGRRVEAVEARAKHLLIRLSSGDVLHTHMRMTGSWHLYSAGQRWRKPGWQARLVLETGDRVAVCFDAPVVELLAPGEEGRHPALMHLGPDVLVDPVDLDEVVRRARARPPETPTGDVLLDQRVVSGVGNIWRCESLNRAGLHPRTPVAALDDATLRQLVTTASRLMRASVDGAPPAASVYGRGGRPCGRCGTAVRTARMGDPVRDVWWCPACQPEA